MVLVVFLRRFDVQQQHDDDGDETNQREGGVSEDGPCQIVFVEFVVRRALKFDDRVDQLHCAGGQHAIVDNQPELETAPTSVVWSAIDMPWIRFATNGPTAFAMLIVQGRRPIGDDETDYRADEAEEDQ